MVIFHSYVSLPEGSVYHPSALASFKQGPIASFSHKVSRKICITRPVFKRYVDLQIGMVKKKILFGEPYPVAAPISQSTPSVCHDPGWEVY
jgi:hypothetical protein